MGKFLLSEPRIAVLSKNEYRSPRDSQAFTERKFPFRYRAWKFFLSVRYQSSLPTGYSSRSGMISCVTSVAIGDWQSSHQPTRLLDRRRRSRSRKTLLQYSRLLAMQERFPTQSWKR